MVFDEEIKPKMKKLCIHDMMILKWILKEMQAEKFIVKLWNLFPESLKEFKFCLFLKTWWDFSSIQVEQRTLKKKLNVEIKQKSYGFKIHLIFLLLFRFS